MADVRVDDSSEPLNQLPLPDISPRGLLRSFGPGMLLMMTAVSYTHLTLPTTPYV